MRLLRPQKRQAQPHALHDVRQQTKPKNSTTDNPTTTRNTMTRRQIERQQRLEDMKELACNIAGAILLGIILLMAAFV